MSFIGTENVSALKTKDTCETEADCVELIQERIRNWATLSNYGSKTKKIGTNNLLVKREVDGKKQRVLAIKIANKEIDYWRIDSKKDLKPQIEECIKSIHLLGARAFEIYQDQCEYLRNIRSKRG